MINQTQIYVCTSDLNLSKEILHILSINGVRGYFHSDPLTLMANVTDETSIVIVDFESGLFENNEFRDQIRVEYPNVKLVLLTLIENLVHCYQLLGGNIFEIVIKNQLTQSKIKRIMATLSYYNQFSVESEEEGSL